MFFYTRICNHKTYGFGASVFNRIGYTLQDIRTILRPLLTDINSQQVQIQVSPSSTRTPVVDPLLWSLIQQVSSDWVSMQVHASVRGYRICISHSGQQEWGREVLDTQEQAAVTPGAFFNQSPSHWRTGNEAIGTQCERVTRKRAHG